MSWTKAERVVHSYNTEFVEYEDVIMIPPTVHIYRKPKPISPPPSENPIIETVDDFDNKAEPKVILLEIPIDVPIIRSENAVIHIPVSAVPPSLPPNKDKDFIDDTEFVIVERMPRFPGCESEDMTLDQKYKCSENELMTYIAQNLKYPALARENNIEGKVFVEFVVDKKGDLTKIKVVRDIGAGCGAVAQKVISNMIKEKGLWKPGMQRGRNVKVKYTMPITFKLAK